MVDLYSALRNWAIETVSRAGNCNRRSLNLCSGDNRPFEPLDDSRDGIPNHTYSASVAATGENLEELGTKGVPMNAIEVNTS